MPIHGHSYLYATAAPLAHDLAEYYRTICDPPDTPVSEYTVTGCTRGIWSPFLVADITDLVADANGRRYARVLRPSDVLSAISELMRSRRRYAVIHLHGGNVSSSYARPSRATIALIVRAVDRILVHVGVGRADAGCTGYGRIDRYGRDTPGGESARDSIEWQLTIHLA